MMMHAGDGEQGGNRRMVAVNATIRQNDDVEIIFDRLAGLVAKLRHGFFQTICAPLHVEQNRQGDRFETERIFLVYVPQFF